MTIETTPPTAIPESTPAPRGKSTRATRKKRRSMRRMTAAQRRESALRNAYWTWEETFNDALKAIITSIANGRRLTAKAAVKLASNLADQSAALRAKRRPPGYGT